MVVLGTSILVRSLRVVLGWVIAGWENITNFKKNKTMRNQKIILVSTVDLCQLDKVVNLASPVPGHSIDVGHWSPIQELTRSHRIRWSQEDLQELL